jgi:hypothetical protein
VGTKQNEKAGAQAGFFDGSGHSSRPRYRWASEKRHWFTGIAKKPFRIKEFD